MKEKLMKNIGYLIVLLDVTIYFIVSYVFIDGFNADIISIIVNGALLFIGAIIANSAMTKQGILNGHDSEKFKKTMEEHIKFKQKIYPKLKYFQDWLDKDYYKLLKLGRMVYVNSAGYEYSEIFTEEGKVKNDFVISKPKAPECKTKKQKFIFILKAPFWWLFGSDWKQYRLKKKFIHQAKRYKITRLTVTDLMNINNEKDPNDFLVNENKYMVGQDAKAVVSRLVFSVLLQSVSFAFNGFNLSTFLTQMLSIVLILLTSVFSMYSSYTFVVQRYRNSILMKINKLEEFDNAVIVKEN